MKQWFQNLKIWAKLALGFSIMLLFMGILGITGYRSISTIQRNLNDIFEVRLPSIDFIIEADRDLFQIIVAERSMIFTSATTERFQAFKAFYEENIQQSLERWEKYKALATSEQEQALFPVHETARREWEKAAENVLNAIMASPVDERRAAIELALGEAAERFESMRAPLDELTEINLQMAKDTHQAAQNTYKWTIIGFLTITGCGLIFGGLLAFGISLGITLPLKEALKAASRLADGDLSAQITVNATDETGQLLQAIQHMLNALQEVVRDVKGASENVASGSQQLSSSATQMSEGANSQATSTEQLSSSMQQMAANINQNTNNALQTEKIAMVAAENAKKAKKAVRKTIRAMKNIALEIAVVEEIAQQTRMLSLNATIEAGKAQDFGKGFAVVASEVRELAGRTQVTAQKINALARSGVKIVRRTGESLDKLVPSIEQTAELVQEISASSREQDAGAVQVNRAIQMLDRATQEHSATSEELAATAEELASQATILQRTIGFFKEEHERKLESEDERALEEHTIKTLQECAEKKKQTTENRRHKTNDMILSISPMEAGGDERDDEFERF